MEINRHFFLSKVSTADGKQAILKLLIELINQTTVQFTFQQDKISNELPDTVSSLSVQDSSLPKVYLSRARSLTSRARLVLLKKTSPQGLIVCLFDLNS